MLAVIKRSAKMSFTRWTETGGKKGGWEIVSREYFTYPGLGAILLIVPIPSIDSLQAFQQPGQCGAFLCLAAL